MSDETTLLPCPFCGGEAHTIEPARYGKSWGVRCECGAFLGFEYTEAEAIAAWNTRAELGSGTLTAEHVREAIRKYAEDDSCYIFEVYVEMCGPIADELNATLGSGTYIALPTDAAGEPIHVGDVLESTNAFKNWCVVMGIGDATKHDHIIYVKFEAAGDISQTWASKFIHRKPDAERGERKAVKR